MNNDCVCRTDRYNTFIPERKMEIHKCAGVFLCYKVMTFITYETVFILR